MAFGEKLGVRFEVRASSFTGLEGMSGNTALLVGCADNRSKGSSRLGVVKAGVKEKTKQNICSQMLHYLNISYAGVLYPCCQCCHGLPQHEVFGLGSLHDKSLLQLFEAKLPLMRDFLFGDLPPICRVCNTNAALGWTFK